MNLWQKRAIKRLIYIYLFIFVTIKANKKRGMFMTFEEILPGLKAKKKYVRTGWGGAENYVQLFDTLEVNGEMLEVTPYFLINVSGEGEGFPCGAQRLVTF